MLDCYRIVCEIVVSLLLLSAKLFVNVLVWILSRMFPMIYSQHTYFQTAHPLSDSTPIYRQHTHFQTPHSLSDSTPTFRQHTHLQTAHLFSNSTPIFRHHTHLQTAHPFSDSTHIFRQHTHFQTAHPLSESTFITYPNSFKLAVSLIATDCVLSVATAFCILFKWSSNRRSEFDPTSIHVTFVVVRVTLNQFFLRVLLFSLSALYNQCSVSLSREHRTQNTENFLNSRILSEIQEHCIEMDSLFLSGFSHLNITFHLPTNVLPT
jgi:hypothetical protein